MKTLKILLLTLCLLYINILPVFAQESQIKVNSVESLKAAVDELKDTGGTINVTKDLVLNNDSSTAVLNPQSNITLNMENHTLFINGDWSFENMTITGFQNPLTLNPGSNLTLLESILWVNGEGSTALRLLSNSSFVSTKTQITVSGTKSIGISGGGSSAAYLNTSMLKITGDNSTGITTEGTASLFFSNLKAEGTNSLSASEASAINMYYSDAVPQINNASNKNGIVEASTPEYQYTELNQGPTLPNTISYSLSSEDLASGLVSPALGLNWDLNAIKIDKAGLYRLPYTLAPDSFVSQTIVNCLEQRPFYMAVIDPAKPFIYYCAATSQEPTGYYNLLLNCHQPIQSFGNTTLWVDKDSNGTFEPLSKDRVSTDSVLANGLSLSGFEAGHSYTFQLEATGNIEGSSNSITIFIKDDGTTQVTDSNASHNHNNCNAQEKPLTASPIQTLSDTPSVPTAPGNENADTLTQKNDESQIFYGADMSNTLKNAITHLSDPKVSKNVKTGIPSLDGKAASFLRSIPFVSVIALVLLCTATMLLLPKESADKKD